MTAKKKKTKKEKPFWELGLNPITMQKPVKYFDTGNVALTRLERNAQTLNYHKGYDGSPD